MCNRLQKISEKKYHTSIINTTMKKIFLFLFILISSINCFSQFSKIHYIPPITATNLGGSTKIDKTQYIYISTPNTTPVNVTITPIGGTPFATTVSNTSPYRYDITVPAAAANGSDSQLFVPQANTGKILNNKGYLIEADDLIYANIRVGASGSQAGGLVAKGTSAYGKEFRIGAMENRGVMGGGNGSALMNFASFVATENNTTVKITLNASAIGKIMTSGIAYPATGITVTLNKNESYVIGIQNASDTTFESNTMLGGHIVSDRDIVVNCGSIAGNSQINGEAISFTAPYNGGGKDFGFDQIVPFNKTGKEYIFVGGYGIGAKYYDLERAIIVANVNGTKVFKDGSTLVATINAGEYYVFNGSDYTNGDLYVTTSENVFAYQCIAGKPSSPANAGGNQNMFFVPPLNCATPSVVNNIPLIEQVGTVTFPDTTVNITTEGTGTVVVKVNNTDIPLTASNAAINAVTGKPNFYTYTYPKPGSGIAAPVGNVSVTSNRQVYVSYYGSNSNATYGSYYSGFDTKPNISAQSAVTSSACLGSTKLTVTSSVATDTFQWRYNGIDIPGEIGNTYTPKSVAAGGKGAGYYSVSKIITGCSNTPSDPIAVSECPIDSDNDGVNNNIDIDSDNDGIINTTESYGNQNINVLVPSGTLTVGNYTNNYTNTTTSIGTGNTFTGNTNGSFSTSIAAGNTNSITQNVSFSTPVSLGIKYNPIVGATVTSLSNEAFIIKTDIDKTLTVSNPSNQLLIDTNYDGIYESGVTQFSSFEIRFILNSAVLLPASGPTPAVDFVFQTYMANAISFTHQNLSTSLPNTASFSFYAASVPKDSDNDGIIDQVDTDSDGDGILDIIEGQIGNKALSGVDANKNGLDDIFEPIIAQIDTDADGVPDYIDLDSDNDGILDSVENSATNLDPDADGLKNYRDLDSDGDTCKDVTEASFTDGNSDGLLGNNPVTINPINGKVTSGTDGYTTPNGNYLISLPIPVLSGSLTMNANCSTQTVTIAVSDDGGNDYKWQVSTDNGFIWANITNGGSYSNATTNSLKIVGFTNGYQYRAEVYKKESACRVVTSGAVTVQVANAPIFNNALTMALCDDTDSDSMDGKTKFNLRSQEQNISPINYASETFSYYTSQLGAINANAAELIADPANYINAIPYQMDVWARVENTNNCYGVVKIPLKVSIKLPSSFAFPTPPSPVCDDTVADGIAVFNLTTTKAAFDALFPNTGYAVAFYPTQTDATNETTPITNLANYTNTSNGQVIWVRVNNTDPAFSSCYTLGTYFSLNVEALPKANPVIISKECDSNRNGKATFNTAALETTLLNGQTGVSVSYFDAANNPLKDVNGQLITSPFPASFASTAQTIKAIVTNNTPQKCSNQTTIQFTLEALPTANPVTIPRQCDDDQDGIVAFNTANVQPNLLNGQSGVTVTYFAENGTPLPSPLPNPFLTATQTIKAIVTNNTPQACSDQTLIAFNVDIKPTANPVAPQTGCDNEFDTSSIQSTILGTQTGMVVKYFDQIGNSLPSPLPNPFLTGTQTIKAVVENPLSTSCPATAFISFTVNPFPNINLNSNGSEDELVCSNNPGLLVQLNAGIQDGSPTSDYTYQWSKDGNPLVGETSYDLNNVNQEGIYTVKVTNAFGCSRIRTIRVTASNVATIESIKVVDLSDVNTVTVNVTGPGIYEYSLGNSGYQDSNFFNNVAPGIHEVLINDKKGCGPPTSQTIAVVGAPKFFTPNNDGYNDYWNIKGVNTTENYNSTIYIFDRYGKLLKQISPKTVGWDGTINGNLMPANDYWYSIKLEDGREAKGHFTLKR